jgi:hypothetical protein
MKGHKSVHHRAKGGNVVDKLDRSEEGEGDVKGYTPKDVNVEKEAKERKKGGKCMPERKHGGKVKEEHRVEGKLAKMHMGRPGRKAGGRVGSDKSPLSSAHDVMKVKDHSTDD